jgi:hypothetical protein
MVGAVGAALAGCGDATDDVEDGVGWTYLAVYLLVLPEPDD